MNSKNDYFSLENCDFFKVLADLLMSIYKIQLENVEKILWNLNFSQYFEIETFLSVDFDGKILRFIFFLKNHHALQLGGERFSKKYICIGFWIFKPPIKPSYRSKILII